MRILITAVLALTPSLLSQQIIPKRFQTVEGESLTSFPFGRSTSVRWQQFYAPAYFGTAPVRIKEIHFRPEGGKSFGKKGIELEIRCSTGPARPEGMSAVFAKNRGKDELIVFKKRVLQLPAISVTTRPAPFAYHFVFDKPFTLDPKKGGLLVEFVVTSQQPGRHELDVGVLCKSPRLGFGAVSCKGSNGKVLRADVATQALLYGKPMVMRLQDALPSAGLVFVLGTKESGNWGGFGLPLPLDRAGAKGCALLTDPVLFLGGVANSQGRGLLTLNLPADSRLLGFWLRFQGLALDSKANPLGLVTSAGAKGQVCGPEGLVRLLAVQLSATTGLLEPGLAPVTLLK
ncbi:MAG TPA: hypothetical protein ENK02_09860 [Planctomycetes bacterium]|nr:hypothetical protein [Planctomycetota bacterium]